MEILAAGRELCPHETNAGSALQFAGCVFAIIIRQLTEQTGDFLHRLVGFGSNLHALQPQHQHAIKCFEAGLQFALLGGTPLGTQFDDVRQDAIIHLPIIGKLASFQQTSVQLFQFLQHVAIDLQVSLPAHSLAHHHFAKVCIPSCHLLSGGFVGFELWQILCRHSFGVAIETTQQVLHLPHVEQIFRSVLLSQLVCNQHIRLLVLIFPMLVIVVASPPPFLSGSSTKKPGAASFVRTGIPAK